jgi:hypothetical protein
METSLGMLIGLFVVLVVFALALVVVLARSLRRRGKPAKKAKRESVRANSPDQVSAQSAMGPDESEELLAVAMEGGQSRMPTHETESRSASIKADPGTQQREAKGEPGDVLLMRVWQDRSGVLVVEAEGQRYRRLYDIRDKAVGLQVLNTIDRLGTFAKGQVAQMSPAEPEAAPKQTSPVVSPVPEEPAGDPTPRVFEYIEQPDEPTARKSRISADPVPFRAPSKAKDRAITLDLAQEIEQLLQARLARSPEFSRRYIHVATATDGGLCFDVDGVRYARLEEITDHEVQALIKAAISDWEARR